MEQERKGENMTETGMHTRLNTRKTSRLNGTAQKGGGIIYTSKTSWLNGTGQKSHVIICTRKTPSTLSRWALSYNMQSLIASQTREAFCADPDDGIHHSGYNRVRKGRVETDEANLSSWSLNQVVSSPSTPIILAYEPRVINKYTYCFSL